METAKFCTQCGQALPLEAKHCPHCGAEVMVLQAPGSGEVEQPIPSSPVPPVRQQGSSGGPHGAPASAQPVPSGGIGTVPPQGPYGGPPPPSGGYGAVSPQGMMAPGRLPSRKRLGGGTLTLMAGVIMLAMHALVWKGQLTWANAGFDCSVIVAGLLMLFARGGRRVALALVVSLGVSALNLAFLWAVLKTVVAAGPGGLATLFSSGIWVSVTALVVVLIGFLVAVFSLFRRS